MKTADSSLGVILVDAEGKTLYYFAKDVPASGTSSCYGQCEVVWPVFSADPVTVSSPLDPADFGTITRTDGTKQTTYYGWPLYYFQADTKTGDVKGENVGKNWFVFNPDGKCPDCTKYRPRLLPDGYIGKNTLLLHEGYHRSKYLYRFLPR